MILSIVYFFVIALGLGFLIDILVKNWSADALEKITIRIGAGILFFTLVGVVLNHLKIILYWPIFLAIALAIACVAVWLRRKVILSDLKDVKEFLAKPRLKKKYIYVLSAFLIFGVSAHMYISGSFNYPWLEDGDPYGYALVSKYIATQKTYSVPYQFQQYSYPAPQGYTMFMGVLHQTNDSIYWNMKFFNALIISLSILFFYYFVRRATDSHATAFWSTLVLAAVPAWLGHFIFSLNFNMSLMIVLFYAIFSIDRDKNWKYVAGLCYAGLIISHFYTSFIVAIMLIIWWFIGVLVHKDFRKDQLDAILLGIGISLIFWVPALIQHWPAISAPVNSASLGGFEEVFIPLILGIAGSIKGIITTTAVLLALVLLYLKHKTWFNPVQRFLNKNHSAKAIYLTILAVVVLIMLLPMKIKHIGGTASRVYSLKDFFIAQEGNMINNPIGIGIAAMTFFLLGILIIIAMSRKIFTEKRFYLLVAVTWTIFAYIGVKGMSLSLGFVPFRMWTFFGLAVALIAGFAIYTTFQFVNSFNVAKTAQAGIKLVLVVLIITSLYYT